MELGLLSLIFHSTPAINFKSSKKIRTRHDETTSCVCDCGILYRKSITCSVKLTTKRSKPNKGWLGRWVRGLYLGNFSCDVSRHHDKAHCFVLFSWLCSPSHCLLKILQPGTSSNRKPILSRKHTNQRRDFCPSNQNEIPSTKAASAVIVSSHSWTKEMWKTRPKTSEVDKKEEHLPGNGVIAKRLSCTRAKTSQDRDVREHAVLRLPRVRSKSLF